MQKNREERGIQKNIPKNYNLDDIISLGLIFLNKIAQFYYGIIKL